MTDWRRAKKDEQDWQPSKGRVQPKQANCRREEEFVQSTDVSVDSDPHAAAADLAVERVTDKHRTSSTVAADREQRRRAQ